MSLSEFMEKKNAEKVNEAKSGVYLIEVDMNLEDFKSISSMLKELDKVITEFKIRITNFIPKGPGGGLPSITFEGDKENLKKFFVEWYQKEGDTQNSKEEFEEFVKKK